MAKARVFSALAIAALTIPVVLFSDTIALNIAVALLGCYGAFEAARAVGGEHWVRLLLPMVLLAAAVPFWEFLPKEGGARSLWAAGALLLYVFSLFAVTVLSYPKITFPQLTMALTLGLFVPVSLMLLVSARRENGGFLYLCVIILGACVNDIFAYEVGRRFGRHKMIPEVSPKKTFEGMAGGIAANVVVFLLAGLLLSRLPGGIVSIRFLPLAAAAVATALLGILGDLSFSVVKRSVGIKDFGTLIPGHGGLLDRIDSLLFVAPGVWFFSQFWPLFGNVSGFWG